MAKKKQSDEIEKALLAEPVKKPKTYISTGSTLMDLCVGGGEGMGFPLGIVVNYVGDSSGGKSLEKNELLASAFHFCRRNKIPFKGFSDDCESGDTFDTKRMYGVDLHPEDRVIGKTPVKDSRTIEELDAKVSMFLDSLDEDEIGIYAVDSLDGLANNAKMAMSEEREKLLVQGKEVVNKGTYDLEKNKFLSQQFFPTQANRIEDKQAILLIVSQVREKLNAPAFTDKMEVTGGKALTFYCHTRLVTARICKITKTVTVDGVEKEIEIGGVYEVKTKKSKTPRPYRSCRIVVYYEIGIDEIGSNIDYLFDLRSDQGKLLESLCKAIPWEQKRETTPDNLKDWLETSGLKEAYTKYRFEQIDAKKGFSVPTFKEWVASSPEIVEQYEGEFGKVYSRDELIALCDANKEMREELRQRVIDRWEAFEEAAKLGRRGKYDFDD